jgi:hypothetical protein
VVGINDKNDGKEGDMAFIGRWKVENEVENKE